MLFYKGNDESAKSKKTWLLLLCGALGLLLLFAGEGFASHQKEAKEEITTQSDGEYRRELEERIAELCRTVKGVSDVKVAITLSGSPASIYATEANETGEEYVILGGGSSASGLYLGSKAPEISGVGVVCIGGGQEPVRSQLISLIAAAFDVPVNRIYIAEAG